MTPFRRLLIAALGCVALAWAAGAVGRFLVAFVLLLFGPGYLLDRALLAREALPVFVRPALWLGLSISSVALLYEWATLAGLPLTTPVWYALLLAGGALVVYRLWNEPHTRARDGVDAWPRLDRAWYALAGVLLLATATRFVQIDHLALPAWVDSVHHALYINVAAEQGRAPYVSLQPYLPVENVPYHWGYHVLLAATMQLSGLALPVLMLWSGQLLNALHVLVCAALASFLWRKPWAGVVAGLFVGLLSLMPAYYVSWGRYTQLIGLLLLPALAFAWQRLLHRPEWRWLAVFVVLVAGLLLVHIRVLLFALALLAVMSGVWALHQPWAAIRSRLVYGLSGGALAALACAGWLWNLAARLLLPALDRPESLVSEASYNTLNEPLLWSNYNDLFVAVALLLAFWALFHRAQAAAIVPGWVVAMFTLANPWLANYLLPLLGAPLLAAALMQRRWVGAAGAALLLLALLLPLPTFWLVNNNAVMIMLFMPVSVLIGGGASLLWSRLACIERQPWRRLAQRGFVATMLLLALWGAWNLRDVVNPVTVIATEADAQAMAWVDEHTDDDARFLVNATRWLPYADRGTDGGWWLLPLLGRWVSTPPILYAYGSPDYVERMHQVSNTVATFEPGQEEAIYRLIEQEDITHVYLGPEPEPLTMAVFADTARFEKIYEQDGVIILAVNQQS